MLLRFFILFQALVLNSWHFDMGMETQTLLDKIMETFQNLAKLDIWTRAHGPSNIAFNVLSNTS